MRLSLKPIFIQEKSTGFWAQYDLLLILAFTSALLTPLLTRAGILPGEARWISDLAVAIVIGLVCTRMLVFDRIPGAALMIAGISVIGAVVATFEGQNLSATAWGWWIMFRFPMVGLYAFLQPHWPKQFSQRLIKLCLAILGMEVTVQIGQYLTGVPPGDHLAGTFGRFGTGPLIIFILFVLCLALGQWLTNGHWKMLVWVLLLGGTSSVLGEMKLFPFAATGLTLLALMIHTIQGGKLHKQIKLVVMLAVFMFAFVSFYNAVVVEIRGTRRLEEYFELEASASYLNHVGRNTETGNYNLGRDFALTYGWNVISSGDVATFLFGMGLGSRGSSRSLGITGQGLERGYYGLTAGTSLLVLMQELGVVGLAAFGGFMLWTVVALTKDIKSDTKPDITTLRYGILLFTLCWPLWLWYNTAWTASVAMLLYWTSLGYVLSRSRIGDVSH